MLSPGFAPGLTSRLLKSGLGFSFCELPDDVVAVAKHCLFDWLAVLHAGRDHPAVQIARALARENGAAPRVSLLASGEQTGIQEAALVNGTAGHVLDFDDAHLPSRIHPSAPLWPAILALGEATRADGAEMLAAFVGGVQLQSEVASLIGESHYRRGWHNTATLGTLAQWERS